MKLLILLRKGTYASVAPPFQRAGGQCRRDAPAFRRPCKHLNVENLGYLRKNHSPKIVLDTVLAKIILHAPLFRFPKL